MSDEDALLEALAAVARERGEATEVVERRLAALSRGALSSAEVAALEREAEGDHQLTEAVEAHRALAPSLRDAIAERALAALRQAAATEPETASSTETESEIGAEAARSRSKSARSAPSIPWLRRVTYLALPLAAAAILLLVWRKEPVMPLPSYELTVQADALERSPRSPSSAPVILAPGSRLRLVLRPDRREQGPVVARAQLLVGDQAFPLDVPIEIAASGAVKIEGSRAELFGERSGSVVIRVAIARPDRLDEALASSDEGGEGWQRFDAHVELPEAR